MRAWHRLIRALLLPLWYLAMCYSPASRADVLSLTFDAESVAGTIRDLVAPVEIQETANASLALQGIVDRFPARAGQGTQSMVVRFIDLKNGVTTEPREVDPLWFQVRNEPDTFHDLGILFGLPDDGIRVGARRHLEILQAIIAGDPAPARSLAFKGAALRWLDGDRYSDEALQEFETIGGTWAEFPDGNSFDLHVRDLISIIASSRRYDHLEPGYERAAIALWRTWVEGLLDRLSTASAAETNSATVLHLNLLLDAAIQSISQALPGTVSPYDPPRIRDAFERLQNVNEPAAQATAEMDLATAISAFPDGRPAGRLNLFDPASAVDPSELAAVWIDALRTTGLFTSELPDARYAMQDMPGTLAAFCVETELPNPRQLDRHDLRPDMEQIAAEMFDPGMNPDSGIRRERYDGLWLQILSKTARTDSQARCEAQILLAAGWDSGEMLEQRALRLMERMSSLAERLIEKQERIQSMTGEERDRQQLEIADYAEWLDATVFLATEMSQAPPNYGEDPATAMGRQMTEFRNSTDEIRQQASENPAGVSEFARQQLLWRDFLIAKWSEPLPPGAEAIVSN